MGASFLLPKFGMVDSSFLGFTYETGVFTVETGASAGPTYRGNAGPLRWEYELDEDGNPYSGIIGTQTQIVD